MTTPLAQGVSELGEFKLELLVLLSAIVVGLVEIILPPRPAVRPHRIGMSVVAIAAGVLLPVAGYATSAGGLVGWFYPIFAVPAALGIAALLRRQRPEARGFAVTTDPPGQFLDRRPPA